MLNIPLMKCTPVSLGHRIHSYRLFVFPFLQHFETLIVCHFHERERAILEACRAYASGMIVASSVKDDQTYLRNKCFAGFKKSLDAQTELLAKELAANRLRALQLKREVPAADKTMSTS